MKIKIYLLLALYVCLTQCQCALTNNETAQAAITKMLATIMSNPSTYKPLGFGSLDSLFTSLANDSSYIVADKALQVAVKKKQSLEGDLARINKSIQNLMSLQSFAIVNTPYLNERHAKVSQQLRRQTKEVEELQYEVDSIARYFTPKFSAYKMSHNFKYVSKTGFDIEAEMEFYLDTLLQKVFQYKDHWDVLFVLDEETGAYKPNYDNIKFPWE